MTYFEAKGVDIQCSCQNEFQSRKQFERSCECCCTRGLRIDCDSCAIRSAHENLLEAFASRKISARAASVRHCQAQ